MSHFDRPTKQDIEMVVLITTNHDTIIHKTGCAHTFRSVLHINDFDREGAKPYEDYYKVAPCAADGKGFVCDKGGCVLCA